MLKVIGIPLRKERGLAINDLGRARMSPPQDDSITARCFDYQLVPLQPPLVLPVLVQERDTTPVADLVMVKSLPDFERVVIVHPTAGAAAPVMVCVRPPVRPASASAVPAQVL